MNFVIFLLNQCIEFVRNLTDEPLIWIFPLASPTPRNGQESGYFYVTLHETVEGSAIWKSSSQRWTSEKETRLEWSDIDIDPATINLGLRSIVVKVWFESNSDGDQTCLDATWGVYFSGLWCIGTHPPAHGRLPPNALIFQIHGNFFSSASHIQAILGEGKGHFKSQCILSYQIWNEETNYEKLAI